MIVNRTEYAPGLGDLASALKRSSTSTNQQAGPSITKSAGKASQNAKVAQSLNNLVKISTYNRDLAAGNINPNFTKAPSAQTEDQARAAFAATSNKILGTHLSLGPQATSSPAVSTDTKPLASIANTLKSFVRPGSLVLQPASPVTSSPAATPMQQAAAAVVASQPPLATQQSALTSTGGGGGGGGGSDLGPADDTDTSTDVPAPTGWAALSGGTKIAIVGGGLVAAGLVFYLVRRRGR